MEREAEQQRETEVGEFLRTHRLRAGLTLPETSDVLCIREAYLKAIEDGRFGDLPGPTYVAGFIRTYSEHLGLDGNEVVRRLKAEPASMDGSSELRFPSPMSEGGMPSGAILLLGIFVALVAYGAWYVSSSRDESIAELISPLPERLVAFLRDGSGVAETEGPVRRPAAPETSASPPVAPVDRSAASEQAERPERRRQQQPSESPGTPADTAAASPPIDPSDDNNGVSQGEVDNDPVSVPSAPDSRGDEGVTAATDSEMANRESVRINDASEGTEDQASVTTPPASTDDETQSPPPLADQTAPLEARIVLRAKGENWVEIREQATDRLIIARLFQPGDTFDVPDTPGLKLLTGNAGGLEILVDGETVPPLGREGMVRRNIPLDAEQLRSGALARN